MQVTGNIIINDTMRQQLTTGGGTGTASTNLSNPPNYTFANGTSTGGTVPSVIDEIVEFCNTQSGTYAITLAASASYTFILSALTDPVSGATVAFVRLRRCSVQVIASTGNDAGSLAPGGTHGLAVIGTNPTITSMIELIWDNPAGLPIVSGTTDQVVLTNNGSASMTFNVRWVGNST